MRLTKQELFNLSTGWNSAWLCHHCMAHDTTYLTFPCRLALDQRRTLTSFEQLCKKNQDGDRCNWAICLSLIYKLIKTYMWLFLCMYNFQTCLHVCAPTGSLLCVRGFDQNMVKWCSLHTVNLGISCWACASAIFELLKHQDHTCKILFPFRVVFDHMRLYFVVSAIEDVWPTPEGTHPKNEMNARLGLAYWDFLSWAKAMKLQTLDPHMMIPLAS